MQSASTTSSVKASDQQKIKERVKKEYDDE